LLYPLKNIYFAKFSLFIENMRGLVVLGIFISFFSHACTSRGEKKVEISTEKSMPAVHGYGPVIQFTSSEHDFGKVREGEKVVWYFKYSNPGDQDLLLLSASASCGCTVPEYSKEPIAPGKEGMIKLIFDTSGRSGKQIKTVSIESNAITRITTLQIVADVFSK
jgi:hypothetical protein